LRSANLLSRVEPSPFRAHRREQGAATGVGCTETGKHTNRRRYTWNEPCDFLAPSLPSPSVSSYSLHSQAFPSKGLLHYQSARIYSIFRRSPSLFLATRRTPSASPPPTPFSLTTTIAFLQRRHLPNPKPSSLTPDFSNAPIFDRSVCFLFQLQQQWQPASHIPSQVSSTARSGDQGPRD
jgi:hypothetical protein